MIMYVCAYMYNWLYHSEGSYYTMRRDEEVQISHYKTVTGT